MSIFSKVLQHIPHVTKQHLVIGGVFTLALAGSIGLGIYTRTQGAAAVIRDCDTNSIDNQDLHGGCGAANATELIQDAQTNNPNDLQTIYAHFGLTADKYDRFARTAQQGTVDRNGDVKVGNQVVMTGAWSMGREKFNSQRQPIVIGGKTYYQSPMNISLAPGAQSLPVMVMFDDNGVVEVAIMNPCGNPLPQGVKVVPKAECKTLNGAQDNTNPNKWTFTTDATFAGNATLNKVVYHFSDTDTDVTATSLTQPVEHTFAKDGEVTATVYFNVPGGKVVAATVKCQKQIKHLPPMAVCTALVPTALDDKNQKFRFTVKVATDKNTTVKNVDFTETPEGGQASTTTSVVDKDASGNIFKEYTFTDDKKHTVSVVVRFTTLEGEKTDVNCKAEVISKKTPVCTVPGHEGQPIDSNCGFCKPGIPIGDSRCKEQVLGASTLVNTGPGDVIGLFAGTSVVGAIGHRLFVKRRIHKNRSF